MWILQQALAEGSPGGLRKCLWENQIWENTFQLKLNLSFQVFSVIYISSCKYLVCKLEFVNWQFRVKHGKFPSDSPGFQTPALKWLSINFWTSLYSGSRNGLGISQQKQMPKLQWFITESYSTICEEKQFLSTKTIHHAATLSRIQTPKPF